MTTQDPAARTLMQTNPASLRIGTKGLRFFRSLASAVSLACLLPISLSAKDKGKEQGKHEKKEGKGDHKNRDKGATKNANARTYGPLTAVRSGNQEGYVREIPSQPHFVQPHGTRENRYGGQWFPRDSHPDWDTGHEHYWNHRHYRWYDGGWLIITTGDDRGYERGYATRNSVARNVQRGLAAQGYYNGPIDGDIGPRSRRAIAEYQNDNGLRPTGQISDSLLESLGLE